MASAAQLTIEINAKDQASKAFRGAQKAAGGFGKVLADVSKIAAGFVLAKGLLQLPQLMNGPVKAASDLGESINAVSVVFGQASEKIADFGKVSAQQVGLSARAFNQLATPLGAMLKNYGMGTSEAAVKTIELTKRAADMASVFNTDVDQALGAVTAALRGETDPIERYGVSVNAAKVEMEAMAMTGKKSAKSLTDQEKATARLNLIMKQTSAVAGDFVNTSDGLANKQRIVAARTEEVSAQLGQKLMPVMLKFKEVQLAIVEAFTSRFLPALQQAITYVTPFAEAISAKLVAGFNAVVAQGPAVAAAFESIRQAVEPLVHLFQLGFNGGQIGGELGTIQTAAFQVGTFFREVMVPAFNDAKNAIHLFFLALQGGSAGGELTTLQLKALALGAAVRLMWEQDIQPAMRAFANIVVTVVKAINDNWGTIGPILETAAQMVIRSIEGMIRSIEGMLQATGGAVTLISGIVETVKNLIHGDWSAAWDSASKVVEGAFNLIVGLVDGFSAGALTMLYNVGSDIIQGLWNGMKRKWEDAKAWVGDALSSLPSTAKKLLGITSPSKVFHEIGVNTMQGYLNGLESKAGEVAAALDYWSAAAQYARAYPNGTSGGGTSSAGGGVAFGGVGPGPADIGSGFMGRVGGGGGGGGAGGRGVFGTVINVTVEGSIRSDRELAGVILEQLGGGGMRGAFNGMSG